MYYVSWLKFYQVSINSTVLFLLILLLLWNLKIYNVCRWASTIFAWIFKDICKKFICFGVGLVCNKIFLLYRMTFGFNF